MPSAVNSTAALPFLLMTILSSERGSLLFHLGWETQTVQESRWPFSSLLTYSTCFVLPKDCSIVQSPSWCLLGTPYDPCHILYIGHVRQHRDTCLSVQDFCHSQHHREMGHGAELTPPSSSYTDFLYLP